MSRMAKLLDPYIGLMLVTVAIAAVVPAQGTAAVFVKYASMASIVFLFFLYGTRLSPQAAIDGLLQWKLHIVVLLCTFAMFPLLGLALRPLFPSGTPVALVTGFLFLCVLPSTVQSSIAFTSIARGNVAAALCAASASNLLGVFISPILAGWLLQAQGAALSFAVFRDITLQLLLPFVAGQLVRPVIGGWVQHNRTVLGYADRGSILLIIYMAFSQGMIDGIWTQIRAKDLVVLILLLCALLTIALLATAYIGRRILRFSVENEIVLQFCGSKKSLASGLPMATVMFAGPTVGMIILPLMMFHQIQLMVCAILARQYAHREDGVDHDTGKPALPAAIGRRGRK
ncbi:MAG: bile acid:sodium symporter family protein [Sphingobium sp.]|nr:bile acid:sodium symporter family protein [Sphingobium sp.]